MRKENVRLLQKVLILLAVIIVPFWIGRELAVPYFLKFIISPSLGFNLLQSLNLPTEFFLIFSWLIICGMLFFVIDFVVVERFRLPKRWALIGLALVQFLSGFGFLRTDYANRTLIVFQDQAPKADAIDLGLLTGLLGFLIYVVLFVLVMIISKKSLQFAFRSPQTVWFFFGSETIALILCLAGPLRELLNLFT
jgi:hypothetical protein